MPQSLPRSAPKFALGMGDNVRRHFSTHNTEAARLTACASGCVRGARAVLLQDRIHLDVSNVLARFSTVLAPSSPLLANSWAGRRWWFGVKVRMEPAYPVVPRTTGVRTAGSDRSRWAGQEDGGHVRAPHVHQTTGSASRYTRRVVPHGSDSLNNNHTGL